MYGGDRVMKESAKRKVRPISHSHRVSSDELVVCTDGQFWMIPGSTNLQQLGDGYDTMYDTLEKEKVL